MLTLSKIGKCIEHNEEQYVSYPVLYYNFMLRLGACFPPRIFKNIKSDSTILISIIPLPFGNAYLSTLFRISNMTKVLIQISLVTILNFVREDSQ
ncbi:hypothetical protein Megpolyxen_01971 (plasmid) [Candidatus Megaera polyxenophila]|nr:hypothetical protein Megpolyxen_00112 [Candidatus Megaera polyxenophila]WPX98495.1 hypothetical protein Megpolyxen_00328 [Candidatus Megaera polyxenophila]WPX98574.1 hypothetical protein Megpolyxen_00409 [Candidatus Megaera polyxenophila]WPX98886.1 hypothetical protein Megpolyxen_00738 [Candidatus Megaera polyxenophila]WPX99067.1 hypothetical protein Megpolyxen_00934 [Candidatus Megaera polyxenophila]